MNITKRKFLVYITGSLLFTVLYSLAYISNLDINTIGISFAAKAFIGFIIVLVIFFIIDFLFNVVSELSSNNSKVKNIESKNVLYKTLIFLLSFIPAFIAFYPGIFAYDSHSQYAMLLYDNISSWHTLAHMAFFFWSYKLSAMVGNDIPWAIFSFIQMFILAYSLGFAFSFFEEIGVKKIYRIILGTLIFLFPVNHIYSISWTKDILFASFFLLTVIQLIRLFRMNKITITEDLRTIIYIVGMMLFRNNAKYAFYVSIPFLLIVFRKKKLKNIAVICLLSVILYRLAIYGLIIMMDADDWMSSVEVCAVLLQQIANVYNNAPDGHELLKDVYGFVNEDMLKTYDPYTADRVKDAVENATFSANFVLFIKTWIKVGLKHPYLYIQAFIRTNLGAWYIPDKVHSYIYGRSYILYGVTDKMDQIAEVNPTPWIRNIYDRIFQTNGFQNIPVIEYFFRPALYTVSIYVMGFFAWANKRKDMLAPYVLMILYFGTVLLSPTALVRYVYCYMLVAPIIIINGCIKK